MIMPYEYVLEDSLDWIRALRRIKMAKKGKNIPKSKRLYLKDNILVSILPLEIKLYKDEQDRLFVVEEEVKKWDRYKELEDLFKKP